jgi:hypothetical protein
VVGVRQADQAQPGEIHRQHQRRPYHANQSSLAADFEGRAGAGVAGEDSKGIARVAGEDSKEIAQVACEDSKGIARKGCSNVREKQVKQDFFLK